MHIFRNTHEAYCWVKGYAQGPVSVVSLYGKSSAFVAECAGNFWYMASVLSFIEFFKL